MSKGFLFLLPLVVIVCLFACEKEVKIKIKTGDPKLVVEGQIETDNYPFVILTKSIGYFSKIDLATLENSFVHGAVVKVSDGISTITLREYGIDTGFNGANKFYFYSIDTSDFNALNFRGVAERYYKLTVETEGKLYESTTKIPNIRPIDSLWFRPAGEDTPVDSAVFLMMKFKDPDTISNYYRYFTQRNDELFFSPVNSVFNDEVINGTTIDSVIVYAGFDRSKDPNLDSLGYFFMGDTVTLRWCATDKGAYDFFNTYEYSTGTIGNPFASPVNVISNISNGALGVWAGYGVCYRGIRIR